MERIYKSVPVECYKCDYFYYKTQSIYYKNNLRVVLPSFNIENGWYKWGQFQVQE